MCWSSNWRSIRGHPCSWGTPRAGIRLSGQELRGFFSSRTTILSTARFLCCLCHFWRSCRDRRYSHFSQRRQNTSARYWTWRHRCWLTLSSLVKVPGGKGGENAVLARSSYRWLGAAWIVRELFVIDRPFTIALNSHIGVLRPSS